MKRRGNREPETDLDALRKAHRFVRDEREDGMHNDAHGTRLAIAYESKLFREFALADLSRFETKAIGLRWRTKQECQTGKGETICGALSCSATEQLASFELPFSYREGQERTKTTTLVKLRVCPACATKVALIGKKDGRSKRKAPRKPKEQKSTPDSKTPTA